MLQTPYFLLIIMLCNEGISGKKTACNIVVVFIHWINSGFTLDKLYRLHPLFVAKEGDVQAIAVSPTVADAVFQCSRNGKAEFLVGSSHGHE